jgi:phosphate transport system ATP-binding protein
MTDPYGSGPAAEMESDELMQQAARVADRTAFMPDGKRVEVGPTHEIFTNPTDPRTEEYVTSKFG